jgi:hypothetical protein
MGEGNILTLQSGATILYSEDMQDGFVVESILTIRNRAEVILVTNMGAG